MCTSCVTLNYKVKGQRHNIETYFFEFSDIDSVLNEHRTQVSTIYIIRDMVLNTLPHV